LKTIASQPSFAEKAAAGERYNFGILSGSGVKWGVGVAEMRRGQYYAFLFSGIKGYKWV